MKKIPMKKRERPEQRAVTFTKRRNGLFKKAEELCVLCDAQIAMLVSSPNKKHSKIYSFGHSLILDAVLNDDVPDAVDDETKKSALSLYNEAKALEHYMENNRREVEEDLDSIQSVEVVHLITDKMKRVKENVNIRLNILKSPKIVTSGSNSAYATTNHCDGDGQFKHNNNIIVIDDYDKHDGLSQFDTNIGGTSSGSTVAAAVCGFNHDNGNDHFKNDNNVIIINDNNKHDGQSHYDTSYENFSTLTPLGLFNDYNPSLSSIYGSSFVDMDYNRIVPESVYGFSSTGQIVEGNKEKYDVQQTVTSSASNYDYNFDQSFVGGEHNTKKADECMWVELKNKEANSWAITTENLPNFGYLNQEVRDGDAKLDDYWASANSTSNSIILNVANNDAPLFTDAIRTLDCAYQSANVNPPLSMSIAGTVEYKGLPQSNDWPLP